jgi:hypothetical protein
MFTDCDPHLLANAVTQGEGVIHTEIGEAELSCDTHLFFARIKLFVQIGAHIKL